MGLRDMNATMLIAICSTATLMIVMLKESTPLPCASYPPQATHVSRMGKAKGMDMDMGRRMGTQIGMRIGMWIGMRVVDVEIGMVTDANYGPRTRTHTLVSFDPLAVPRHARTHERYAYVVTDATSAATPFYVDAQRAACSSANRRLPTTPVTASRADLGAAAAAAATANRCEGARQRKTLVRSTRLSDFARMHHIARIASLMMDAGGADFAIIKDLLENARHEVSVGSVTLHCQYTQYAAPMFATNNDCDDIRAYLRDKAPAMRVIRLEMTDCLHAVYAMTVVGLDAPRLPLP